MTPEAESLLVEFLREDSRHWRLAVDQRLSNLEARAAVAEALRNADVAHEHEWRTQSGNWNLEALQAAAIARRSKSPSVPPLARWLAAALDSAWGKIAALVGAGAAGVVAHWLLTHVAR